jgi:hypothetical protein
MSITWPVDSSGDLVRPALQCRQLKLQRSVMNQLTKRGLRSLNNKALKYELPKNSLALKSIFSLENLSDRKSLK